MNDTGHARTWFPTDRPAAADRWHNILVRARYPGAAAEMRVRLTLRLGQNVLTPKFEHRLEQDNRERRLNRS